MAVIVNEEMPPRMETRKLSSTLTVTSSSGSFRMISKNRRAGMMHSPGSAMSAGTPTVMPVSRLYPVSITFTPAFTSRPSSEGMALFGATVREATEMAETSSAFSQVNFIQAPSLS